MGYEYTVLWNALGIGNYEIDKKHYEMKQATVWNNKHNMLLLYKNILFRNNVSCIVAPVDIL